MFQGKNSVTQENKALTDWEGSTLGTCLGSDANLVNRHSFVVSVGKNKLRSTIVTCVHADVIEKHSADDKTLTIGCALETLDHQREIGVLLFFRAFRCS